MWDRIRVYAQLLDFLSCLAVIRIWVTPTRHGQPGCQSKAQALLLTQCNGKVIKASVRELASKVDIVDCSSTPRRARAHLRAEHVVALVSLASLANGPDWPGRSGPSSRRVRVLATFMKFDTQHQ